MPKLFSYAGPDLTEPGYTVYKHLLTSEFCEFGLEET